MKALAILGSTGSIGTQTLAVCARYGYRVSALACGTQVERLAEQIRDFRPELVSVADEAAARRLQALIRTLEKRPQVLWGREGLRAVAEEPTADMLMAAMVGTAGLEPVVRAIRAGKDIALANKEVLVAGGALVKAELSRHKVRLLPVDSEHSAIWQCLWGAERTGEKPRRIFLTASGGPFLGHSAAQLEKVTRAEALAHPTWSMGNKITVDSASLMNKGLELIEAVHLFELEPERIEVLVHPQSIIHSMVEWEDGSVLAQLSQPDMRLPIQVALAYPERLDCPERRFDPFSGAASQLSFQRPDEERFPCLRLARAAAGAEKSLAIVMNAANELAVEAFLAGRLPFMGIPRVVEACMERHAAAGTNPALSLEAVLACDAEGRRMAAEEIFS